MEVIDLNIVDPTQFDKDSKYFDPKSKPDNPRWDCVKVKYKNKSNKILSLPELKILFNEEELLVVKKGNLMDNEPRIERFQYSVHTPFTHCNFLITN